MLSAPVVAVAPCWDRLIADTPARVTSDREVFRLEGPVPIVALGMRARRAGPRGRCRQVKGCWIRGIRCLSRGGALLPLVRPTRRDHFIHSAKSGP